MFFKVVVGFPMNGIKLSDDTVLKLNFDRFE